MYLDQKIALQHSRPASEDEAMQVRIPSCPGTLSAFRADQRDPPCPQDSDRLRIEWFHLGYSITNLHLVVVYRCAC